MEKMNEIWNSKGKKALIDGQPRRIESVRACYGRDLQIRLSSPLKGKTSHLYNVNETNAHKVVFI